MSRRSSRLAIKKENTASKQTTPKKKRDDPKEAFEYSEEDDDDDEFQNSGKPTELFSTDDIDGKRIYRIPDSNMKKNAMFELARKCSTPQKSIKTSKKVSKVKEPLKHDKGRKNDFNKENEKIKNIPMEYNTGARVLRSKTRSTNYHLKPDEFFAVQSEKSVTSSNTLSKLKKQLDENKLQELLKKSDHVPIEHQQKIKLNYESYKYRFEEWVQIMEEGFNVLLYGLGSKRSLINDFYKKIIPDEPTLVINGFFPSLTIKEILDNIITELLGLDPVSNQSECFDMIKKRMDSFPNDRIYLLIHNIDGEMLRSQKAQEMLSRLANIPNVHLLASIDHINAPLIWDNVMRARFNFYWVETITFLPYEAETSYETSLLIQKSGALALLSMKNIFASLTPRTKKTFLILIKYQLEHGGTHYSGMTFKDLLKACKEGFVAATDSELRAHLTEFTDHKLIKTKRNNVDAAESLVIPLDNGLLKQFFEEHSNILN